MGLGKTYSTKYLLDSNNSSGVAGQVLSTTSTGIDWVNANTLPGSGLWLESGNDIYNSNSGNVGIGVTGPTKTLHVVSAAEAALFQGTATWGTGIQIDATATGGRNFQIQSSADAAGEGGGKFLIVDRDATGGPTRIAIDSTGNVGILSLIHI